MGTPVVKSLKLEMQTEEIKQVEKQQSLEKVEII